MLDVDGNEHVDKNEFLKLKNIIGNRKETKLPKNDTEDSPNEDEATLTSLQAYFFGKGGKRKLQYTEFCSFMENLQIEMQEMEFLQFSKGMDTMRREDFAEWLLHYTNEENNEAYWENMRKRIPPGQSISFEEFKSFCLFTNNLEDFAFTLKMISEANRPIGIAEFKRAVMIATGNELSDNVLDTVFKLFDLDGDNCLSHKEFLEVMDDRVRRGLKTQTVTTPQSKKETYETESPNSVVFEPVHSFASDGSAPLSLELNRREAGISVLFPDSLAIGFEGCGWFYGWKLCTFTADVGAVRQHWHSISLSLCCLFILGWNHRLANHDNPPWRGVHLVELDVSPYKVQLRDGQTGFNTDLWVPQVSSGGAAGTGSPALRGFCFSQRCFRTTVWITASTSGW
ncbi:MICU2 protein, partial [Polypterus senegalus]